MKTLSYTQEYFLCGINSKGSISAFDTTFPTCIVAGGIMELLNSGYINNADNGKLVAGITWDDSLPYIKSLYETIVNMKKPKGARGVLDIYVTRLSKKPFTELFSDIGASLVESKYADEVTKQGILSEKIKYIPKAEAVTNIIEKIRAEFLEDGTMDYETLCLASLLYSGGLIRNYFSKVEAEKVKVRLTEIRKSKSYKLVKDLIDYTNSVAIGLS